jgi:hypothetical protein
MAHPFVTSWEQNYGAIPPQSWRLKLLLPTRWLRIHTLPGSKRYAETQGEAAEVATRQMAAAKALFEDADPVWVVTWRFGPLAATTDVLVRSTGLRLEEACVLAEDEQDEPVTVLAGSERWNAEGSASLRCAIAEDRERAMWVHAITGEVFAPYDGGVDLIFSTVERRDANRPIFADWLSTLSSGL